MRRTIAVGVAVVVSGSAAWFVWGTSSRVPPADRPGSAPASGTADVPSAPPAAPPSPTLAARPSEPEAPTTSRGGKPDDRVEADPERAPVAALLDELSSRDADVRRAAADRIARAGYFAIERVARRAASLDAESWRTFADAIRRKDWGTSPVGALVAAAHTAPDAHRRRLIDLARQLNPEAGRTPTPQEIEAIVRRELVEKRGMVDDWPGGAVAIFGHAGMAAVLELLQDEAPDTVDPDRASSVLSAIAQPEDIPALRRLLLEGRTSVASALGSLDAFGFTEASDALVEAVRSGQFDGRIAGALCWTSDRDRAAGAVRAWVAGRGPSLTDHDRVEVACLLANLESRADIAVLEGWTSSSRDPATLLALGRALTKLGSVQGIDMLVRIVEEKRAEPSSQPGPQEAGRLGVVGFDNCDRWVALRSLDAVAAQSSNSEDRSPGTRPDEGPWEGATYHQLDQFAAEVRAWWEASRDRMRFDEKAGEWRLESD